MKLTVGALAALCLLLPALAHAQTQALPSAKRSTGQVVDTTPSAMVVAPAGGVTGPGRVVSEDNGLPVTSVQIAMASTVTPGTVTTANTYQLVLAANTARKGCSITNKSTATILVSQAVSPNAANSFILNVGTATTDGGRFDCASPRVTISDAIYVTSATAGAAFLVTSQ